MSKVDLDRTCQTGFGLSETGFGWSETGFSIVCESGFSPCETSFNVPCQTGFDETGFSETGFATLPSKTGFGFRFPVRFEVTVLLQIISDYD